jgi:hypothetical protein
LPGFARGVPQGAVLDQRALSIKRVLPHRQNLVELPGAFVPGRQVVDKPGIQIATRLVQATAGPLQGVGGATGVIKLLGDHIEAAVVALAPAPAA